MYDIIIIGAGAAGLTAAMYACRKKLKTLVLSLDIGGQMNLTNYIENYPGCDPMTGWDLMKRFEAQAKGFGAEITPGKVRFVEKKERSANEKPLFILHMADGTVHECRALILAYGRIPKTLDVPGEERFFGKGVHTAAVYDAPLYRQKIAAVVGGGNSAIEGALELVKNDAEKVYIIHRREQFRADEVTMEKAKSEQKIEFVVPAVVKEVRGNHAVNALMVQNTKTNETKELPTHCVFVAVGSVVDASAVKHIVHTTEQNEIVIDQHCRTSQPGIFACGDCTQLPYKQTITSAGEGAKAALEAYFYLSDGKGVMLDWT